MFGTWIPVDERQSARLVAWLVDAVQLVEQLGLPDVLVHGDFHPGNVRFVDDRIVIFDWSAPAIAKPFVDVMTWATWLPHDPSARDTLWQSFAEVWADVLPPAMGWNCARRWRGSPAPITSSATPASFAASIGSVAQSTAAA